MHSKKKRNTTEGVKRLCFPLLESRQNYIEGRKVNIMFAYLHTEKTRKIHNRQGLAFGILKDKQQDRKDVYFLIIISSLNALFVYSAVFNTNGEKGFN